MNFPKKFVLPPGLLKPSEISVDWIRESGHKFKGEQSFPPGICGLNGMTGEVFLI